MSANKTDISQIRKYLNGELDAKAMHRLEREAQDDPFLMDALEGYEVSGKDQQPNLSELQQRLADRVAPKKERSIILWRVLPIAATLLIALTAGYLFLKPQPEPQKYTKVVVLPNRTPVATPPQPAQGEQAAKDRSARSLIAENPVPQPRYLPRRRHNEEIRIDEPTGNVDIKVVKEDTTSYIAGAYAKKKADADKLNELLKKLPGVEVGDRGEITVRDQQITKARINGKDFTGKDFNQAIKNLPADAIQKIQIIEDYGDQPTTNTAAKNNAYNYSSKILDIKADTASMQKSGLNNALAGRVPGLNSSQSLNEVTVTGYGSQAKKEVASAASVVAIRGDTVIDKMAKAKAKKSAIDSTSNLAEVVVVGYADKNDSPVKPANGWKSFLAYVKEQAVMPDNSIGKVKLAFEVDGDGVIYGIRILKGSTKTINEKAIDILKNGPAWIGSKNGKEVKVKIKFHKRN